jgi:hypothetical protein
MTSESLGATTRTNCPLKDGRLICIDINIAENGLA